MIPVRVRLCTVLFLYEYEYSTGTCVTALAGGVRGTVPPSFFPSPSHNGRAGSSLCTLQPCPATVRIQYSCRSRACLDARTGRPAPQYSTSALFHEQLVHATLSPILTVLVFAPSAENGEVGRSIRKLGKMGVGFGTCPRYPRVSPSPTPTPILCSSRSLPSRQHILVEKPGRVRTRVK